METQYVTKSLDNAQVPKPNMKQERAPTSQKNYRHNSIALICSSDTIQYE